MYSLTFTTAEGQQATVDQMYIRQNGEVTVSKASNVKTSYVDLGGTLTLNEGAALENTNVNMFIRGRAEKNANGKAQLIVKDGARFNHSATGPNALLVVGGVNGDGPATASGLIYMTGEGSYFEAESVQLKDKTDATIGEIAFKIYDGATAVIRDTISELVNLTVIPARDSKWLCPPKKMSCPLYSTVASCLTALPFSSFFP